MTTKQANQIQAGDVVCERDGFQWQVAAVRRDRSSVVLSLQPSYQTALLEQPCEKRVHGKSYVWTA